MCVCVCVSYIIYILIHPFREYYLFSYRGFEEIGALQGITSDYAPCVSLYAPYNQTWKCFIPQYFLSYIQTPLFVIQSYVDAYQIDNLMKVKCTKDDCNKKEMQYIDSLRKEVFMIVNFKINSKSGYWVTGCPHHTLAHHEDTWGNIKVKNQLLRDAYLSWYNEVVKKK